MLTTIGDVKKVPAYVERVKAGDFRLMGFGHRIYKNYDPRARIIKETADAVFEVTGRSPLLDVALELEKIALEDEYFVSRKLYPNVDFYSGLIYEALGLPVAMFPVMFAIPRTAGWLAQWLEGVVDPEQKIARPRQLFVGEGERDYVPSTAACPAGSSPCRQDRNGRAPLPWPARFGFSSGRAESRAVSAGRSDLRADPDPRLETRPRDPDGREGRAASVSLVPSLAMRGNNARPGVEPRRYRGTDVLPSGGTTDHWLMLGTGAVRSSGGGSRNPPLGVLREVRAARSGVEPRAYGPTLAPESHCTICARDPCGRARGSRNGNQ